MPDPSGEDLEMQEAIDRIIKVGWSRPTAEFRRVEYDVEPIGYELFVLHNRDRVNFEVARAVLSGGAVGAWEPLNVSSEDELVTGVDAFATFLAVSLRTKGQTAIRIVPRDPGRHRRGRRRRRAPDRAHVGQGGPRGDRGPRCGRRTGRRRWRR